MVLLKLGLCVDLHLMLRCVKVRKVDFEVMSWKPFWGQIEEGVLP